MYNNNENTIIANIPAQCIVSKYSVVNIPAHSAVNIPPLLSNPLQPSIQPLIPNLKSTNLQKRSVRIDRFDRYGTESIIDSLNHSISSQEITQNVELDIQITDFKHGLYPSVNSTDQLILYEKIESCMEENNMEQNIVQEQNKVPQTQPPSLFSLKLGVDLPKNLQNHSNNGNIFPIIDNSNSFKWFKPKETSIPNENTIIQIEDIINEPNRSKRSGKLVIIFRGLPGSGKSFLTNKIKQIEEQFGSEKPKILSIDNYFMTENEQICKKSKKKQTVMDYEYDQSLDDIYQNSLVKSFKKTVDDMLFNFIIIDMINEKMDKIEEINSYAKNHGFYTFIIDLYEKDLGDCFKQNIHKRTIEDMQKIQKNWEQLPSDYTKLDVSIFDKILNQNGESVDSMLNDIIYIKTEPASNEVSEASENEQINKTPLKSKWEENKSTKFKIPKISNSASPNNKKQKKVHHASEEINLSMEDYMKSTDNEQNPKNVILKKKDIGFAIGQSVEDRQEITEDYVPTLGN